jgi:hypothetical protein
MTEQRSQTILIHHIDEIPQFADEGEEAAYWRTHRFSDELIEQAEPLPAEAFPPGWEEYVRQRREQRQAVKGSTKTLVLVADLVNASGDEYHAFFILGAHALPEGTLTSSPIEGESIFLGMGTAEALTLIAQRVKDIVTEAAKFNKLDQLLAEHRIMKRSGPPFGLRRDPPRQPSEGWSVRFAEAAA